jgi:ectoine hydroxylase-related dioxygenase (phytanoyl-CoA dioxygenase family)
MSSAPERLGWLTPSDPDQPLDELRARYHRDGYLWLKGILDRETVLAFRGRFFGALAGTGLVKDGSDPQTGLFSGREDAQVVNRVLMEFVRTAAYEAFCLMEPVWRFYDAFLDGSAYLHKRKILRHTVPGDPACTGAHYDLIYLRGGTNRLCTSWIPIGDTPVEMGGLVYLEGSDAAGRRLEAEFSRENAHLPPAERINAYNKNMGKNGWLTRDLAALADRLEARWLMANYEAGDMVVHSPYMIHASTTNIDPLGRIRLSTDIRYQRVSDEIDARWNNHWSLEDML